VLRYREGEFVNRKRICWLIRVKGWMAYQQLMTPKPRAQEQRSRTFARAFQK
jgi:hypothetical protein